MLELVKKRTEESRVNLRNSIERLEATGRIDLLQYQNPLLRRFFPVLKEAIEEEFKVWETRQRTPIYIKELQSVNIDELCVLALIYTYREAVLSGSIASLQQTLTRLVRAMQYNDYLTKYEPELGKVIVEDLRRRSSIDLRYRYLLLRNTLKDRGVKLTNLRNIDTLHIGGSLYRLIVHTGFIDSVTGVGARQIIQLSEVVYKLQDNIRDTLYNLISYNDVSIEPIKPWISNHEGGLPQINNLPVRMISFIRGATMKPFTEGSLQPVMDVANMLQEQRWRLNEDTLDNFVELYKTSQNPSIRLEHNYTKPIDIDHETASDAVKTQWKIEMRDWYNEQSSITSRSIKRSMVHSMLRDIEGEDLYFAYMADFRYRLMVDSKTLSPQGDDLTRSLLRWDNKEALTEEGWYWYKVGGANRYGIDKVSFDERVQWVEDNHDRLLSTADDPYSDRFWEEADGGDTAYRFLAWVKEYARISRGEQNYTELPTHLDGTCNGLQHMAMLLRCEKLAEAVNVLYKGDVRDIYSDVAVSVNEEIRKSTNPLKIYRTEDITRNHIKTVVMTIPYNLTKEGAFGYILQDVTKVMEVPIEKSSEFTQWFRDKLWLDAMPKHLGRALIFLEAMSKRAGDLIKGGSKSLIWVLQDGVVIEQDYTRDYPMRSATIRSGLLDTTYRVARSYKKGKPDVRGHVNGVVPNIIHSLDAYHLRRVVNRFKAEVGGYINVIHDDFGVHPNHISTLRKIIVEEFVEMYRHIDATLFLPDFELGNLDIEEVLNSEYMFS